MASNAIVIPMNTSAVMIDFRKYSFISNYDLSKQSYTFSVTCLHIYPDWYQQNISKIIRTFAPGGLMTDFYC